MTEMNILDRSSDYELSANILILKSFDNHHKLSFPVISYYQKVQSKKAYILEYLLIEVLNANSQIVPPKVRP